MEEIREDSIRPQPARRRSKLWLFVQKLRVHCVLITLLLITLLLTAGWLACGESTSMPKMTRIVYMNCIIRMHSLNLLKKNNNNSNKKYIYILYCIFVGFFFFPLAAVGGIVRSELGTPSLLALPFYYQLVATGLAFLVAISATATLIISMNGLAKLQVAERAAGERRASDVSKACVHDTVQS